MVRVVRVTRAQVIAARILIRRREAKGLPVRQALRVIAEATRRPSDTPPDTLT